MNSRKRTSIGKIVPREEIFEVIPSDLPALADEGWGDVVYAIRVMKTELERTCYVAMKKNGSYLAGCNGKGFVAEAPIKFCPFCGGVAHTLSVTVDGNEDSND